MILEEERPPGSDRGIQLEKKDGSCAPVKPGGTIGGMPTSS